MTDYQIAQSTVERLVGHLTAVAAGTVRPEQDPAAEQLRLLVPSVVRPALWQPFEQAPDDPARRAALVDGLAAAMTSDPGLVQRLHAAWQPPQAGAPAFAPIGAPIAAPTPVRWAARAAAERNPLAIIGAITAGFVVLAVLVLGLNVLLGSNDEDDAEAATRDFMIALIARDNPKACGFTTSAMQPMIDCTHQGEAARLSSNNEYRDLINDALDVKVYINADDTATATGVYRLTPDTIRRMSELRAQATGEAPEDDTNDTNDTLVEQTVQLGLRKIDDRWLIASYRRTGMNTY
ncbi:hypothetical protein BJF79_24175 [Actinomadura sp. CNU-125]|uniref:hypothetical protein n=1 Tax=Actinomadura sp. CNU-125 TaxID=1904961 RepID=UPI000961AC6C|nr:hypothetical protein [Actinomadura sp. CNU-125]OLT11429.1 hypothetical protein BJF79_24175 [Actinomadura sp. CNU-125]